MTRGEGRTVNIDDLLAAINDKREIKGPARDRRSTEERYAGHRVAEMKYVEAGAVKKTRSASKNLPFGMIVLLLLVAALGAMVIVLRTEVVALKTEITDLKDLKAEVSANDQSMKIASLESKLEESNKEREILKTEIIQLKGILEEIKSARVERKRPGQR